MIKKKIGSLYRRLLCKVCGLSAEGVLSPGAACKVEGLPDDESHGDIVHPCVRFIEKGFEGHQWWMVYTPYYAHNDAMENPFLCYADAEQSTGNAPTHWNYYCKVKGHPPSGYNSDPTMLFKDDRLYVFWRENYTDRTRSLGCSRATVGCYVQNRTVFEFSSPQLIEIPRNTDREISPTFFPHGTAFRAYAVHVRFCSKLMYHIPGWMKWRVYRLLDITNKLGIYCRFKGRGVAIWDGSSLDSSFKYIKTIRFKGVNWLYHPWHMDIFDVEGEAPLYAIVQTNYQGADICLAYSENKNNRECFSFFKRPLITEKTIGLQGIYKPTALVVSGMFHLYYTANDDEDPQLNRLFVISIPWKELLKRLQ